ncbi:hypothetical protein [Sinorhizobium sp. GL28]|uniref:hypothetical protein n=1 Tax=Sinorhizobium sp. GL28 TaxID=1358418 RepID=UPI00071D46DF|nr:hypothetical protein [Sinorhizobium sp. GL28]KSV89777.1 hypothetical protein N184_27170 [Sinorhizobium sp. GL28]
MCAVGFGNFIRVLMALGALATATPATAEPGRSNVETVFDAFLACRVDFFDLLARAQADFPAREFRVKENYVGPVWQELRGVPFSAVVNIDDVPLSAYMQRHVETVSGPVLNWGFVANRKPAEVVKMIEARLSGARFASMDARGFELSLDPRPARSISTMPPAESFRSLLVFEGDRPDRTFIFCSASGDNMSELKTDERTGRKRLPPTASLFVLPKTVNEEDAFEAFSRCDPTFFTTLAQAKARFGRVTIEPLFVAAPDGQVGEVSGSTVTFAEPVRAYGLDLTGYTQMMHKKDGKPVAFWWGFRARDDARLAAHWLSERAAETLGKAERTGWGEWALETRPRAHAVGEAAEELAYRVFKVEPSHLPLLTNVLCGATADMMGDMTVFPEPGSLFKQ